MDRIGCGAALAFFGLLLICVGGLMTLFGTDDVGFMFFFLPGTVWLVFAGSSFLAMRPKGILTPTEEKLYTLERLFERTVWVGIPLLGLCLLQYTNNYWELGFVMVGACIPVYLGLVLMWVGRKVETRIEREREQMPTDEKSSSGA